MQICSIVGIHQNGVTGCAVDRIDFGVNERVELFATAGGDFEKRSSLSGIGTGCSIWRRGEDTAPYLVHSAFRKWNGAEMGFAIRCSEFEVCAKVRSAILNCITRLAEILDPFVERNNPGDFLTHFPASFAAKQIGAVRIRSGCYVPQDFPFSPSFADRSGKLRAEHNAALSAGFG